MKKYRYLLARRTMQLGILFLYIAANIWGWKILEGNLSSSLLLQTIPLTDPYAVLQIFAAGAVVTVDMLIGAGILFIAYAAIGGRMFCSWVCPINIVTDTANWLRRRIGFSQVQKRVYMSRNLRYWILGLSLIISAVMGIAAFEMVSPISMLHRGLVFGMGFGFAAVLVIFLFDLLIHENGWCGYICPLGGFYSLISRFSLLEIKYDVDKCGQCMECKVVCPEKEVLHMVTHKSEGISMSECTKCARCIDVCEDDALEFGIRSYVNNKIKKEKK